MQCERCQNGNEKTQFSWMYSRVSIGGEMCRIYFVKPDIWHWKTCCVKFPVMVSNSAISVYQIGSPCISLIPSTVAWQEIQFISEVYCKLNFRCVLQTHPHAPYQLIIPGQSNLISAKLIAAWKTQLLRQNLAASNCICVRGQRG